MTERGRACEESERVPGLEEGLAGRSEKTRGAQKTTGTGGGRRQGAVGPGGDCDRGGVGAAGRISRLQSHC